MRNEHRPVSSEDGDTAPSKQRVRRISGLVRDAQGAPTPALLRWVGRDLSDLALEVGPDGQFDVALPGEDTVTLIATGPGHQEARITIEAGSRDQQINLTLGEQ